MKLKITIIAILTFICGCVTPQKISPSKVEIEKAPKEILQQLAPLFPEGTKPLLIDQEGLMQDTSDDISACVDPKTGAEEKFLLADLKSERVQLSYASMARIVSSLQVMGIKAIVAAEPKAAPYTVNSRGQVSYLPNPPAGTVEELQKKYTCSDLPIFYQPKPTPEKTLSNVLDGPSMRGQGFNTGSKFAFVDMPSTDFGLNGSLIVFSHPEGRKRLDRVKKTISKTFDVAPIQVYLESMVLEVNESGIEELGVLYKRNAPQGTRDPQQNFEVGALSPSTPQTQRGSTATSFFTAALQKGSGVTAVADLLSLQINALIAKGSAEVLSRPSVTALHNHPAIIEVTEQKQFPLRQSTACNFNGCTPTVSFLFEEVTPGILLQIRPKISMENNEVTMEIDVQVKALVVANDGKAVSDDGAVTLATKPGSSTRRVHTFAIVPNKTPIIIGGLVSKDKEETINKIPWLGDIPYLGKLFGTEKYYDEKKELIVVITPHIVYDNTAVGIQNPKDTAMFDDTNMVLFRDSYRVRTEDVFDLGFVYNSKQFQKYRDYVVKRSARDRKFAKTKLAKIYSGRQFPAGDALVTRMVYDIVGKRKLEKSVSGDKIIITEQSKDGSFKDVTFLEKEWQKAESMSATVNAIGQGQKDYGLELKFSTNKTDSSVKPHVALRILPKAEIAILQETDKGDETPNRIFIASKKDLKKIRKAVIVREIIKLNNNANILGSLNQFRNGTKLLLPVVKKTRYFLLDLEVARSYHHIKNYYSILEKSLQESFLAIEAELEKDNEKLSSALKIKN